MWRYLEIAWLVESTKGWWTPLPWCQSSSARKTEKYVCSDKQNFAWLIFNHFYTKSGILIRNSNNSVVPLIFYFVYNDSELDDNLTLEFWNHSAPTNHSGYSTSTTLDISSSHILQFFWLLLQFHQYRKQLFAGNFQLQVLWRMI